MKEFKIKEQMEQIMQQNSDIIKKFEIKLFEEQIKVTVICKPGFDEVNKKIEAILV